TADFYDAEILTINWETKPEIIKKLLPKPLKPTNTPIATAFVANYPKTNFGISYLESALSIACKYKDEEGVYILAMPVDNDMAMAAGREVYGYPKKMGKIYLNRNKNGIIGWTERHGIRFMEIKANLIRKLSTEEIQNVMNLSGVKNSKMVVYNYKHFPSPEGNGFDYNPRLIKEEVEYHPYHMEVGEGEIILKPSKYDPWSEVEVVRSLGVGYTKGNNKMLKGTVIAEVQPFTFAPHAFLKWDPT
ncbi:MAG: acetoacetate decarboxylase family protein, partial [Promethearchaeota archaeon]